MAGETFPMCITPILDPKATHFDWTVPNMPTNAAVLDIASDATGGTGKLQSPACVDFCDRTKGGALLDSASVADLADALTSCDEDAGVRHGWRTPHVECTDLPDPRSPILILGDYAEEAVCFVGDSGGEKDSARLREKIPQAIKLQRRSIRPHERLDEIAGDRIVIVDETIPKIADPKLLPSTRASPQGALRFPFETRRLRKLPLVSNTLMKATAGTMDIILPRVILLGIGHKNFAIEIADAEWRITSRKGWIVEAVGINLMKTLIEGMNFASMEICRIQEIMTIGFA